MNIWLNVLVSVKNDLLHVRKTCFYNIQNMDSSVREAIR